MLLRLAIVYAAATTLPAVWIAVVAIAALGLPRPRRTTLGIAPALSIVAFLGWFDRPAALPDALPAAIRLQGWIASPPEGLQPRIRALLEVESESRGTRLGGAGLRRVQIVSRTALPAYGTRIEVSGRLRRPAAARHFVPGTEAAWLLPTGAAAILEVDTLRRLPGAGGPAWRRSIIEPLRGRVAALLEATLAGREAALLAALVIGKRDGLDAATRDAWAALGVNHILSISGMHVALVAGAVLAWGVNPRRPAGLATLLAAVWGYAALGGLGPTVLRAALMTTWAGIALGLARGSQPLRGLGVAGFALALQMPARRHDLGLQLSCAATAGLLITAPAAARLAARCAASRRAGRAAAWAGGSALLGAAAQVATLPLQIWHFGAVSWISPVANLVMVPLSDAALVLALVALPVALGCETLGRPLLLISGGLLWLGCELAAWASRTCEMRWFVRVDEYTVVAATLVAATGLGVGWLFPRRLRIALSVAAAACVFFALAAARHPSTTWQVESLDVGQGDAVVVTVGESTWLVDAGDARPVDRGARVVVPHLRRAGVRRLRGLVLSHPHRDHCGGAASVLAAIGADTVYVARASVADSEYVRLQAAFPHIPMRGLAAAERLCLAPGYEATVVWPESTDVLGSGPNGCSLVLWARGPERPDLFLMGDLEADGEARVVAQQGATWSAVRDGYAILKAGHHGSRTSSTPEFLAAIDPEVALVSVGSTNRYGHPGAGTLSALATCGATVLRTDVGGAVRLVQRGTALWLERPGEPARMLVDLPVDVAALPP